jgi:hypothetical protein
MATINQKSAWVLRNMATGSALYSGDLILEISKVTLSQGTVEVPTGFANGCIDFVSVTKCDSVTPATLGAYSTDLVVTSGAITVVGAAADSGQVVVAIYGHAT